MQQSKAVVVVVSGVKDGENWFGDNFCIKFAYTRVSNCHQTAAKLVFCIVISPYDTSS